MSVRAREYSSWWLSGVVSSLAIVAALAAPLPVSAQNGNGGLKSGIEHQLLDRSIAPGDDLFDHVNGKWLEKTEIPADKSDYGSFTILQEQSIAALRDIMREMSQMPSRQPGSDEQKVGDFYLAFMNTQRLEELGAKPIESLLAEVRQLESKGELAALLGKLPRQGVGGVFACFVMADAKNSSRHIVYLTQSGLTLPDRDYYLKDEAREKKIREAYRTYIESLMKLAGAEDAAGIADRVIKFETKIAQVQWSRVENRNPIKTYNKRQASDVAKTLGDFDWKAFAAQAGIADQTEIIVRQPSFLKGFRKLYDETPLETWKDYLAFHVVDEYASLLSKEFDSLHFDFHRKTLSGVAEQSPRWKRAVGAANGAMGELVGKLYVKRHFKPEAKARMEELVATLKTALGVRIRQLDWMSDDTKERALEKLAKIRTKIGYPDKWKDYSKLEIRPDDLVGNMRRAGDVAYQRMIDKLGKPVDKDEWHMTPQTVNAYYSPLMNEIVFPAAILQPPFFFADADDAVNYGGIGAVIGHELSHGFDDSGSRFDADGNLSNWWSVADRDEFEARANRLVSQYEKYEPIPGMKINGRLTLGENIGDLGGVNVAYTAYQLMLDGGEAPVIDGFTGPQRFFLGYAQIWRRKYRPEELRRRLFVDPHSPAKARVNGIVRNIDAFYETFNVGPGHKLYLPPEQRVKIW